MRPALFRLGVVVMSTVVTLVGALVLASATAGDHTRESAVIAVGALALVALTMPPALVGAFVSYWSWDDSARRRLRILLAVLVGVQLLGAAGMLTLTVALPSAALGGIALIVVALIQTPVSIVLGRAARRRELRAPHPALDGADAAILEGIRRGWRRAGIGATIGLVVGVALIVALGVGFPSSDIAVRLLFILPASAGIGTSIGGLTSTLPLARRMRDLLGGNFSSARRIGLAIKGKQQDLTDDEEERAARYAAIAPAWLNLQLVAQAANIVVSLSVIANLGAEHADQRWLLPAFGALALAGILTAVVARGIQIRRLRDYAATHPVTA